MSLVWVLVFNQWCFPFEAGYSQLCCNILDTYGITVRSTLEGLNKQKVNRSLTIRKSQFPTNR